MTKTVTTSMTGSLLGILAETIEMDWFPAHAGVSLP
jgi:hypothetical protein